MLRDTLCLISATKPIQERHKADQRENVKLKKGIVTNLSTDEAAQGKSGELAGIHAVLVNVTHIQLN